MHSLHVFIVSMLIINFIPGPAMLYVVHRTISHQQKGGLIAACGVELGTFIHVLAATFGLSLIILQSKMLFHGIQYLGAFYLIYLGISAIVSKRKQTKEHAQKNENIFTKGILVNILNPKVVLFLIAFLPQFINPADTHVARQLFILGVTFNLSGFAVNILVSVLTSHFSKKSSSLSASKIATFANTWLIGGLFVFLGSYMFFFNY